mgnify:CR=1 FL=1
MRLKSILLSMMSFILSSLIVFSAIYIYFEVRLPSIVGLRHYEMQMPMQVLTADGKLIEAFGQKYRFPVKYHEIPKTLIHAILATEDQHFFQHGGVDLLSLVRAGKVCGVPS